MQSEIEMSEKYNDILKSFILPKGTQQCFPSQKYCEREIILSVIFLGLKTPFETFIVDNRERYLSELGGLEV